jgi:hypothetical protein
MAAPEHGLNVALRADPDSPHFVGLPPAPPERCSQAAVAAVVESFMAATKPELLRCKRAGGFAEVFSTVPEASTAGLALLLPSPTALYGLLQRLLAGETVDPAEPLTGGDAHGICAVFCGASGGLSGKLYQDAVAAAQRQNRTFADLLITVRTAYVDEEGEEQTLTSTLFEN